eukprot:g5733.t1
MGYSLTIDETAFHSDDPVLTGRQLLELAGRTPVEEHVVLEFGDRRQFEDIDLEESIDLREPGTERFVTFHTDRLFNFVLDGQRQPWGADSISEHALRRIAGIGSGGHVWLERRDEPDLQLAPGQNVPLDPAGVESFYTERAITIIVNGRRKSVDSRELTFDELLALAFDPVPDGPARAIEPRATERPYPVVENEDNDGVFRYIDTASSRAGINDINARVSNERVGIIGLGGTGSYVLDLVAKTPVQAIHLFDDDDFLTHNAFRCPGAASLTQLRARPSKVAYLAEKYGALHRGIVPFESQVGPNNLESLDDLTFVFVCIDNGDAKRQIVQHLEELAIPFIDAGLGVYRTEDDLLGGVIRVTTSTPDARKHVHEKRRISFANTGDDDYATNIQIAELNALNAALVVIRWKKFRGFYLDLEAEHHCTYTIDGNAITNEDKRE